MFKSLTNWLSPEPLEVLVVLLAELLVDLPISDCRSDSTLVAAFCAVVVSPDETDVRSELRSLKKLDSALPPSLLLAEEV